MELKKLIAQKIKELQPDMIETSKKFVSINSVNPRTGGPGEKEVAEYLQSVLQSWKFDEIKRYDAPDSAVPYGYRPNIIAIYKGKNPSKTLWFMTHMDKVPA
ncbi:MAG TPA: M20 family metallo-hydrolase, partial [Petrotogaceae bacterium]|nr:M20 family metallo-hydrolase [Petrotogaceae bacterium]